MTNVVELVDIAMVGRLGQRAVAAVGYAAQCVQLLRTLLTSLGVACLALVARGAGAGQAERTRQMLSASLLVSMAVAACGVASGALMPRQVLASLHAEPDII